VSKVFLVTRKRVGHSFGGGLLSIRGDVSKGIKHILGNGKKIRFWLDVWAAG
jgi:hypothetical protein